MNEVGLGTVFSETKSVTFSRLHGILYVALLSNQQLPCGVGCVSHNFVNLFPLCSLYHCAIELEIPQRRVKRQQSAQYTQLTKNCEKYQIVSNYLVTIKAILEVCVS